MQVTWWVGVIILSELAAAATFPIAQPGCLNRCGDVEIPYPFGLSEGCSIDPNFVVNCSQSFGQFQPILGNLTVTNISLQGQFETMVSIAKDCYEQGVRDPSTRNVCWFPTPVNFTVSSTQNKFVVVGCDTKSYLYGSQQNESYRTGCASVCESTRYMVNGSCSGVGCCELNTPIGLRNINITIGSFDNYTRVQSFNPCGYAFISKKGTFDFSVDSLRSLQDKEKMPMVLDWVIGTGTCEDVQNKSSYACGGNSTCIHSNTISGYRCKCKDGYDGNPYLPHGCQGINFD